MSKFVGWMFKLVRYFSVTSFLTFVIVTVLLGKYYRRAATRNLIENEESKNVALELRDRETESHTKRVTETTLRLAQAMGLSDSELVNIRHGALMHDIGKMGIPDNILLKPGPLDEEEWQIMHNHPDYTYDLLAPIPYLRPALDIPYCHHEKFDGTGYPRGLEGEQIPLVARIFAVVDVWDALSSDRLYRPA